MYRVTSQRKLIVDIIKDKGHVTMTDIQKYISDYDCKIALSTLYRSLESLEEQKVVRKIPSKFGQDLYETYDQEKHDHFVCLKCHEIYDIPKRRVNFKKISDQGYIVQDAETTYYGICKKCDKKVN